MVQGLGSGGGCAVGHRCECMGQGLGSRVGGGGRSGALVGVRGTGSRV